MFVESLGKERFLPVCAPSLLAPGSLAIEDLPRHRLIHSVKSQMQWPRWFVEAGIEPTERWKRVLFDRSPMAIDAAVDGLGIGLESELLAWRELSDGRLVCPVEDPPEVYSVVVYEPEYEGGRVPNDPMARLRAVLRRANKQAAPAEMLRVGSIVLDRTGHIVQVNNQVVDLTPSEFELLATLMTTPGRAFSRLDLLEYTSGDAYEGYERTIDVHIRNLRAKIEPDPSNPRYIQTVYGMGYRFAVNPEA